MGKDKKEKKEKKDKKKVTADPIDSDTEHVEEKPIELSPIAQPLAEKKLSKKVFKTIKKAAKQKHIKRGVKEVVKGLRKGEKGLVIIAGDISPIDVITHVPVLCEDADVPYCFVSSKEDLGTAGSTKRPTSCIMVVPGGKKKEDASEYSEVYAECVEEVKKLNDSVKYL